MAMVAATIGFSVPAVRVATNVRSTFTRSDGKACKRESEE